jgi:hypothetical protein
MTVTRTASPQSASRAVGGYVNKNGEPIPDDAFENDFGDLPRPLPLTREQRKEFDEDTEALRKYKNKRVASDDDFEDRWDENLHPRDEDGKWTSGGSGDPIKPEAIRSKINEVAAKHDFPAKRIHIHDGDLEFELNGEKYRAAGVAHVTTNIDEPYDIFSERLITLYSKQLTPSNIEGVLVHEIEHVKFETAWNRYHAELRSVMATVPPEGGVDQVMNPDGSLKPPYDKQYPAYAAMHGSYFGTEGIRAFAASDGVSEYSYDWWKNWKGKGGVNAIPAAKSAVHETLAEMARIKNETGKFPEHMGEHIISWRGEDVPKPTKAQMEKSAKLWRDLYRAVDKVWKLKP